MDFDSYFVECVRDEKHGEQFVIGFLSEGKMKRTSDRLDEKGARAKLKGMGLTAEGIKDKLRRARAHADE